jgi:hypothetical protein
MDPTGQAQDKAQQVAGQAQEKAQQAAGQAKDRVRDQLDQRSTQAGEQVSSSASDLRSVADQLRQQGKDQPAKLADQAADRAERLGGYLKHSDADTLLRDIEDFGRRQPLAIIAGGLALGFAASRLLKASSQERHRSDYATGGFQPRAQIPRRTTPAYDVTTPSYTDTGATEARPVPPAPSIPPAGEPGRFERPGVATPGGGL